MFGGTTRRQKEGADQNSVPASQSSDWADGEPRWMRDQRTRQRRLSQRGRATLAITGASAGALPPTTPGHLFERVPMPSERDRAFTVEYTLDAQLTQEVFDVLETGHVGLGNVVVMDPNQGRVLAYASTDPERF